jgi:hypothetical protein
MNQGNTLTELRETKAQSRPIKKLLILPLASGYKTVNFINEPFFTISSIKIFYSISLVEKLNNPNSREAVRGWRNELHHEQEENHYLLSFR